MSSDNSGITWVVLDLETTGLDPATDLVLEVGAVLVNQDLAALSVFQKTVNHGMAKISRHLSDFTRKMHTENGLLQEIGRFGGDVRSMAELDAQLSHWLLYLGAAQQSVYLIGNSIWYDRQFITRDLPITNSLLFHRMIDVSTLNVCYDNWVQQREKSEPAHRAVEDCYQSLDALSRHKGLFDRERARLEAA